MRFFFLQAITVYCLWVFPCQAQTGKDAAIRGKELAESLCSVCHVVGSETASSGKAEIPSFYSIANRPNQTAQRLVGGIIFPHPEMPKVSFTNKELRDITEYILSLRKQ